MTQVVTVPSLCTPFRPSVPQYVLQMNKKHHHHGTHYVIVSNTKASHLPHQVCHRTCLRHRRPLSLCEVDGTLSALNESNPNKIARTPPRLVGWRLYNKALDHEIRGDGPSLVGSESFALVRCFAGCRLLYRQKVMPRFQFRFFQRALDLREAREGCDHASRVQGYNGEIKRKERKQSQSRRPLFLPALTIAFRK